MIWVVPAFKEVFTSFGADLPAPTLFVMAISDFFVKYWYMIFGGLFGPSIFLPDLATLLTNAAHHGQTTVASPYFRRRDQKSNDCSLDPYSGNHVCGRRSLVESLDSVGGAAGNAVYLDATIKIQTEVSTGTSLTVAMQNSNVFPTMVTQMVAIGEESGALDNMLGKVADFYEEEVDEAVASLSSLMEPLIMVILGVIIGGLVVAMYLPIFKLGSVV
jgi:type IV pilus assembly protein PilC